MIVNSPEPKAHAEKAESPACRFLMCAPGRFPAEDIVNFGVEESSGVGDPATTHDQWNRLYRLLSDCAAVELIPQRESIPDLVFTASAGLIDGNRAVISRFRQPERRRRQRFFRKWFLDRGYDVIEMPGDTYFGGADDALFLGNLKPLVVGYGFNTTLESVNHLSRHLDVDIVPLRLSDERFHHLNTCFCPLEGGRLLWYPEAFDERSRRIVDSLVSKENRFAVSEEDAMAFACNAVNVGTTVILNRTTPDLTRHLAAWGFQTVRVELSRFMSAGGSARCLTLRLDEEQVPREGERATPPAQTCQVDFRGHLIDEGHLASIADGIVLAGGSFSVQRFEPGLSPGDRSLLSLKVSSPDSSRQEEILRELRKLGGICGDQETCPVQAAPVTKQGVAPPEFYSTTIFPTSVYIDGCWIQVEKQRMDGVIVLKSSEERLRAECCLIRDLEPGERVVVGFEGIRVYQEQETVAGEFKFMSSPVSSERSGESIIEDVAQTMLSIRRNGGRIVFVAGPVVIHTGGGPHLETLIRGGYVDALLGGNAIAVHDIESRLYGTSLGVNLRRGKPVVEGHRHHINAINVIRECGGIAAAVKNGIITGGVFHALIKTGTPFCLAGSIRDDGPLPETEMDLIKAQRCYAELLQGAEMVVMLSSMLHSIGAGNMIPAGVRMVCVDINPSVATKLADRGSLDSTPVVTDVGLFLESLSRKLISSG